jgi:hypothetical protein
VTEALPLLRPAAGDAELVAVVYWGKTAQPGFWTSRLRAAVRVTTHADAAKK